MARPLHILERLVIRRSMSGEVCLDGGELWSELTLPHQHERLHYACKPAVAVFKRVHRNQVQVRHRRLNNWMDIDSRVRQRGDQLLQEWSHRLGRWRLVPGPILSIDPHSAGADPPGALSWLEIARHVVEVQKELQAPYEIWIGRQRQDSIHRLLVATKGVLVFGTRAARRLPLNNPDGIFHRDPEPLDRRRRGSGFSLREASDSPSPSRRVGKLVGQAISQGVQLGQLGHIPFGKFRGLVEHDWIVAD